MRFLPLLALGTLSLLGPLVVRDARACGGCFHGPPPSTSQSPTVVTDHRMAVALSGDTTTLWDQIQYAGDPGDFSWVLPVQGGVTIGVGSASFIDTLDQQTTPVVHAPQVTCTYSYSGGYGGGSSSAGCGCSSSAEDSAGAAPSSAAGGAVDGGSEGGTVTSRETVGPYDVVVIHGTDATSIVDWLKTNKYVIPAAIQAILDQYVKEGFDFVAVRLSPGKGVQAMRPIRASWKGKSVSLPLRMVAAGVGDKVGIKLFVIGDGRWTVGNFDVFSLDASALTWDFAAARSDYTLVRDERSKTTGYGSFALESSIDVLASSMPSVGAPPSFDAGVSDGGGVDGGGPGFGPTTSDVEIAFGT